jgi:hypothetical protein
MSRGIVAAFVLALAGAASLATAQPAKADSFSFGYSSGGSYHGRPGPGWDRGRHYHRPPPRVVYYAPPPRYYRPPPRVIYAPPPTIVYADPPPVIYAPPVVANNVLPGGPLQPAPYCREYQSTMTVGGQQIASYGTACQQPDGSWRIVQ